jgi:hypothetical protein
VLKALPKEKQMDDLDLLRRFRSDLNSPAADRAARARRALLDVIDAGPGRRRVRLPLPLEARPGVVALIGAPAAAAVAALVLVGTAGEGGPSVADAAIIHRADAALSPPPNEILHTKLVGDGVGAESWQLTSPPYTAVGMKGPLGQQQEQASDSTTSSVYDPASNTIQQHADSAPVAFDDPLSQVRQELHNGRAQVLGSTTTGGVPTYKIRFATKDGFSSDSLVAYVDKRTYRPILLSDPQRNGTIVELHVVALEYLPRTAANLRLLSLTARHPGARVVVESASKAAGRGK